VRRVELFTPRASTGCERRRRRPTRALLSAATSSALSITIATSCLTLIDALLDVCLAVVSLFQCLLAATCSAWLFVPDTASADQRLDGSLPLVNIDRRTVRAALIEAALGLAARDAPNRERLCVEFVDQLLAMNLQHIEYSVTCSSVGSASTRIHASRAVWCALPSERLVGVAIKH